MLTKNVQQSKSSYEPAKLQIYIEKIEIKRGPSNETHKMINSKRPSNLDIRFLVGEIKSYIE